jgi:hypothetical protein
MSEKDVVKDSIYWKLQSVDVSKKLDDKLGMKYLSWSWAWAEVKKIYPNAVYTIYENENRDFLPIFGNAEFGYFVKVSVTIDGLTHESRLPVMNGANKAMKDSGYSYKVFDKYKKEDIVKKVDAISVMEINKAVQRALVKACAMHGLGLNVWKGEDLPEVILETINSKKEKQIVEEISIINCEKELAEHFSELKQEHNVYQDIAKLYEQRAEEIKQENSE